MSISWKWQSLRQEDLPAAGDPPAHADGSLPRTLPARRAALMVGRNLGCFLDDRRSVDCHEAVQEYESAVRQR